MRSACKFYNPDGVHFSSAAKVQDNHPEELITDELIDRKLNYIHHNPVIAGWLTSRNTIVIQARGIMQAGKDC